MPTHSANLGCSGVGMISLHKIHCRQGRKDNNHHHSGGSGDQRRCQKTRREINVVFGINVVFVQKNESDLRFLGCRSVGVTVWSDRNKYIVDSSATVSTDLRIFYGNINHIHFVECDSIKDGIICTQIILLHLGEKKSVGFWKVSFKGRLCIRTLKAKSCSRQQQVAAAAAGSMDIYRDSFGWVPRPTESQNL